MVSVDVVKKLQALKRSTDSEVSTAASGVLWEIEQKTKGGKAKTSSSSSSSSNSEYHKSLKVFTGEHYQETGIGEVACYRTLRIFLGLLSDY